MQIPQGLTLARNRDLEGLEKRPIVRQLLLAVLAVVLALGLLNLFGQRSSTSTATGAGARLEVTAPTRR